MKTLFVTVTEFLENGGKLETGRQFFIKNKTNEYIKNGRLVSIDNDKVLVANTIRSWELYIDILFVQIECTPIYK